MRNKEVPKNPEEKPNQDQKELLNFGDLDLSDMKELNKGQQFSPLSWALVAGSYDPKSVPADSGLNLLPQTRQYILNCVPKA